MSALVCDICGGNLAMDASGELAICKSCGMKHSKERVKVKVQEIQGTVKVDGAVETVKGNVEKERLLKNAENLYHINELNRGKEIYEKITVEYSTDYRGWLGLLEWCCRTVGDVNWYDNEDVSTVFLEEGKTLYDSFDRVCQITNAILSFADSKSVKVDIAKNFDRYFDRLLEISPSYFCDVFINRYENLGTFKTRYENLHNEVLQYNELCHKFNSLGSKTRGCIAKLTGSYFGVDVICTYVYKNHIGLAFNQGFGDGNRIENRELQVPFKTLIENGIAVKQNEVNARKSNNLCQHCGGTFKGLFNKVCSNCGKPKDY